MKTVKLDLYYSEETLFITTLKLRDILFRTCHIYACFFIEYLGITWVLILA